MKTIIVFLSILSSTQCFGWGKNGHRIVAQIAYEQLNRVSKIKINNLIENENFSNLSTWADAIKSDSKYDFARVYHYINIPKNKKATDVKGINLLSTLIDFEKKLKSESVSRAEKKELLKFYIHLMGDLHNPLHVGFAHDKGGNNFKVRWFSKQTNLHHIWDEELIEYKKMSYTEYTRTLYPIDRVLKSEWVKGDYENWINDQLGIRSLIYPKQGERLGHSYHYKWSNYLDNQLRKAGIRLAYKLNQIFSNQ